MIIWAHWTAYHNYSSIPVCQLFRGLNCLHRFSYHTFSGKLSTSQLSGASSCKRGRYFSLCRDSTSSNVVAVEMPKDKKMIWMPILQEGVHRFDVHEGARKEALPSLSFQDPSLRESDFNAPGKGPTFNPYSRIESGIQITTVKLPPNTNFYGTGEVSGTLERTGRRIFCWNTDAWGYGPSTTALYQSHPWVLAILDSGYSIGFLADTTRRAEVDLRKESTIKFVATSCYPVITFGPYPSPEAVLSALSTAIGTLFMPPKWALGYQQCRWSYMTAERVSEVVETFREKNLPCDVAWMDIDYMDGYKCFTFNPERFPAPAELGRLLHEKGFKCVWMLDPGIKQEKGYSVFDSGTEQDVWVLAANGKAYVGDVWPGPCVFPDFTQQKVRKWWAELVKDFVSVGVDGIWNDMNEPAIFKSLSKTMPEHNIHRGDQELGGKQSHLHYHNVYGMLMARATYEGMLLANPNKRPFVLTRANLIGGQRYAATWTGDNLSSWEHLRMTILMSLNLSLSGQPFSGPDIGGFGGNCTPQMFARWIGIGAMLPFARGHTETGTKDHEPWAFGKECEDVSRLALNRRYQLLPHFYTLLRNACSTGVPIMTPLFFADTHDPRLRTIADSFLLGSLLVSASVEPRMRAADKVTVLPKGIWQMFDFDDQHPDLPLLYLKGGAIIPTGPLKQHVDEANRSDALTLIIALDEQGKAEGTLYEDDGLSYDYHQGNFLLTHYEAQLFPDISSSDMGGKVSIRVKKALGMWSRPYRPLKVRLLIGDNTELNGEGVDGEGFFMELPGALHVAELVERSKQKRLQNAGQEQVFSDVDDELLMDGGVPTKLVELNSSEWSLKVVPWIGGRIMSMIHNPTGTELLEGKLEQGGYEEYSGVEYRSAGCVEEYSIVKGELIGAGGLEEVSLEGDVGGGVAIYRDIKIPESLPKVLQISSKLVAKTVGAGSGGFSRLVCLRVHPSFKVANPFEVAVKFTAVDGTTREIFAEAGEIVLHGADRPNGKWVFLDREAGLALVNRFNLEEVSSCLIHWAPGICNLELWSEERPVSQEQPISISHEYEIKLLSEE